MTELANALVALILGPFLVPAAIVTGNQAELCELLGGKYDPTSTTDICPEGEWVNVVDEVVGVVRKREMAK